MAVLHYHGPDILKANQLFNAGLIIELNEYIVPEGRIVVALRHVTDFGDAQIDDPGSENFVTINFSRGNIIWEFDASHHKWYRHPWNQGFEIIIKEGSLYPGDTIDIKLGGEKGYRCQSFVEDKFVFRVGVQKEKDSDWVVTQPPDLPGFKVFGGEPVNLKVNVTDINSGKGTVCLKFEDIYGNPAAVNHEIEVSLILINKKIVDCDDLNIPQYELKFINRTKLLKRIKTNENMLEIKDVPLPADGKWHTVIAATDDGRFWARSNPFGPSLLEGYRLYWGNLHSHSGLCDGTNSPGYLYEYGRKAAGLDFAAVTSHDNNITPDDWEESKKATKRAHCPGEYVTFLGYEWSGWPQYGGDHVILYPGDEGPLIFSHRIQAPEEWLASTGYIVGERTITEVIKELGDTPAMIIPHVGGSTSDLDYFDPAKMPAYEIHSVHRNHEAFADEAIKRGLKCAFIGGGDDHRGALGDCMPAARERFFSARAGLMGVYAKELTRESIWEAIFGKRVYATNGCKTALVFTANGFIMGSELELNEGDKLFFKFEAVLDGWFDHAELIHNSSMIARFSRNDNQILQFVGEHESVVRKGANAYYLKVFQTDGGAAWSSPVWIIGN